VCKSHFISRFCNVELGLKSTFDMVLEPILARLLGLSSHPLSGRYWTTLTYRFHARVEESWREMGCVGDPTLIKDEAFQ